MQIGLLLCLYWQPVFGACAITILSIIIGLIPNTSSAIQIWGLWLSVGILGYRKLLRPALSLLLIQTIIMMTLTLQHYHMTEWSLPGVTTFNIVCAIMAIIGYALKEHQEAEWLRHEYQKRERLAHEQKRLQRDVNLASRIHDSTTRGLTLISLLSEQCVQKSMNSNVTEKARLISSIARSTLEDVREVIDILDRSKQGTSTDDSDENNANRVQTMLVRLLTDNDDYMESIGIYGSSYVTGLVSPALSSINSSVLQEIRDLIGQIYTNIAIHGLRGMDTYHMRVEINMHTLHIREFNAVGKTAGYLHMGKGLSMHSQRIKALGGQLDTHAEDGILDIASDDSPQLSVRWTTKPL